MILLKRFVAYPESFTQSEAHDKKYYVFYKFVREDHGAEEQGAEEEGTGKYAASIECCTGAASLRLHTNIILKTFLAL